MPLTYANSTILFCNIPSAKHSLPRDVMFTNLTNEHFTIEFSPFPTEHQTPNQPIYNQLEHVFLGN